MSARRSRFSIGTLAAVALAAPPVGLAAPAAAETQAGSAGAPPGCETGCEQVFSHQVGYGAHVEGWRAAPSESSRYSVLAYYVGGELRDTARFDDERVEQGSCGWEGDAQRCAITYTTGAHSSGAKSVFLTADGGIETTDDIVGAAPGAALASLDGNGRADVVLRRSTYEPNYAAAPQYWETYLEFEGKFVRTGCTAPEHGHSPVPSEPVYASCAYV
ncbi:hypothetical protein GCM10027174_43510 [Salinifilum aidingensis]